MVAELILPIELSHGEKTSEQISTACGHSGWRLAENKLRCGQAFFRRFSSRRFSEIVLESFSAFDWGLITVMPGALVQTGSMDSTSPVLTKLFKS